MARKPSQADRLYALLKDGAEHDTPEIQRVVYGGSHLGVARIASRVHDLRKRGLEIEGRADPENPSIYRYQLKNAPKPPPEVRFEKRDGVMTAVLV